MVEFLQGAEGVAQFFPTGKQFVQNGCVGFGGGVEQHHRAVVDPGQKFVEGLLLRGLGIVVLAYFALLA